MKACPPRCCEGDFFTPHLFLGKGAGFALFALAAFRDLFFYPFNEFLPFKGYNFFLAAYPDAEHCTVCFLLADYQHVGYF